MVEDESLRDLAGEHVQSLRYLAAALAVAVAFMHISHARLGFPRLVVHLQVGTLFDPRPLLFTLSALAILVGILIAWNGIARRPIYAAGALLMVSYLLGYAAWHTVLDHGAFWPHIEGHGHHDAGTLEIVVSHLRDDLWALSSKLLELATLVVLLVLLVVDRPE